MRALAIVDGEHYAPVVRDALAELLECNELTEARQARVVAYFLEVLEEQRLHMPRQRGNYGTGDVAL